MANLSMCWEAPKWLILGFARGHGEPRGRIQALFEAETLRFFCVRWSRKSAQECLFDRSHS